MIVNTYIPNDLAGVTEKQRENRRLANRDRQRIKKQREYDKTWRRGREPGLITHIRMLRLIPN